MMRCGTLAVWGSVFSGLLGLSCGCSGPQIGFNGRPKREVVESAQARPSSSDPAVLSREFELALARLQKLQARIQANRRAEEEELRQLRHQVMDLQAQLRRSARPGMSSSNQSSWGSDRTALASSSEPMPLTTQPLFTATPVAPEPMSPPREPSQTAMASTIPASPMAVGSTPAPPGMTPPPGLALPASARPPVRPALSPAREVATPQDRRPFAVVAIPKAARGKVLRVTTHGVTRTAILDIGTAAGLKEGDLVCLDGVGAAYGIWEVVVAKKYYCRARPLPKQGRVNGVQGSTVIPVSRR